MYNHVNIAHKKRLDFWCVSCAFICCFFSVCLYIVFFVMFNKRRSSSTKPHAVHIIV